MDIKRRNNISKMFLIIPLQVPVFWNILRKESICWCAFQ